MTIERLLLSGRKRMEFLSVCLAIVGLTALLGLAAMTTVDGLSRWLFHQPIDGVRDVASLLIAIAVSCCLPIALVEKAHISVHLFNTKVDSAAGKVLRFVAAIAVAVVSAGLAWQFLIYAERISAANEMTMALRIPTAPFWYCVDFALWCAFAVQILVVLDELAMVIGGSTKLILQSAEKNVETKYIQP